MSCPICGKDTRAEVRPFCSKRCSDIDLGRWLTGRYLVPSDDPEDIEAAYSAVEAAKETPRKPH